MPGWRNFFRETLTVFDKYQARSIKREIRRVLWEVWDPIGVNALGGPRDEYDSYINGVYELLASGADDNEIAKHLLEIVTDEMELVATIDAMRPTVTALRGIELPNNLVKPNTP